MGIRPKRIARHPHPSTDSLTALTAMPCLAPYVCKTLRKFIAIASITKHTCSPSLKEAYKHTTCRRPAARAASCCDSDERASSVLCNAKCK